MSTNHIHYQSQHQRKVNEIFVLIHIIEEKEDVIRQKPETDVFQQK